MANDLWRTPPEVFAWLNNRFDFVLDVAASDKNHLCENYFTEDNDGLAMDWHFTARAIKPNGWVWCNCPYSDPLPWVTKSIETMEQGTGVVMLLNSDQSVRWFARAIKHVGEVINFIAVDEDRPLYRNGRIAFIDAETGKPNKQNNKPQFALVFEPNYKGQVRTNYYALKDVMIEGEQMIQDEVVF